MADWRSVTAIVTGILIAVMTSRWWLPPLLETLRGVTIEATWADKKYNLTVEKANEVISLQTSAIMDPKWGIVPRLKALPGVLDVELGPKEVEGDELETLAFKVKVREKKPVMDLAREEIIPSSIGGIPTDVVE